MFGIWDWAVVATYFAGIAWIGFYFSNKSKNYSEFMFGGGSMPWLAIGISLIATSVSATTFLGEPADAYANDMSLLMLNFGALLAILIIGKVFIPRFRAAGIRSAYELLELRFSRKVRLLAATLYCGHLLLRTGILVYGPSLVLSKIMHVPMIVAIGMISIVAMLYTFFGGIKAVTWTDVIQFSIFFGSGIAALLFVAHAVGSFGETLSLAAQAGKTHWIDFHFDPHSARNIWSAGMAYIVFEVAIRGCDQQFVQRYLSCKSVKEANYSSTSSVFLGVAVGCIFFTLGAFLYVYFQVKKVEILPPMGVNEVFPYFILNILPTGFKGLLVAAIFAAAMGALSSAFTALSNTAAIDLFPRKENTSGEVSLWHAKKWVLIWGAISTLTASLCALGNVSLLSKALFFTSLFTGPLLGMFLLAFFAPFVKPLAVILGVFAGIAALLPFLQIPIFPDLWWKPIYAFAWPWNPLIALSAMLVTSLLLNLVLPNQKNQQKDQRRELYA